MQRFLKLLGFMKPSLGAWEHLQKLKLTFEINDNILFNYLLEINLWKGQIL